MSRARQSGLAQHSRLRGFGSFSEEIPDNLPGPADQLCLVTFVEDLAPPGERRLLQPPSPEIGHGIEEHVVWFAG